MTRAHDGRRSVIAAACRVARGLGLRAGMPLAHAQAMVPGLAVADARTDDDSVDPATGALPWFLHSFF